MIGGVLLYSLWGMPPIFEEPPQIKKSPGMKIIGMISDTHVSGDAGIPRRVFEVFKDVDLIIHAGDLVQLEVLEELREIAPVVTVYGNMDPPEVRGELQEINSIRVHGWNIGVVHDAGLWGMGRRERIARENDFDILVFGHTHKPFLKKRGGVWFINPGSPTNPLPPLLVRPTVGLLIVTEEKVEPVIIRL